MQKETKEQRTNRILGELKSKYPEKKSYDLDGKGKHFVCEIEPTKEHPEFDKALEVIISSSPHKHLKMIQYYTILSGTLNLYLDKETITLQKGDTYTIKPGITHWAKSNNECWVEIYSKPGWTAKDHIPVEI